MNFPPIRPSDIAGELALLDAVEKIEWLDYLEWSRQVEGNDEIDPRTILLLAPEFEAVVRSVEGWATFPLFIPELPI